MTGRRVLIAGALLAGQALAVSLAERAALRRWAVLPDPRGELAAAPDVEETIRVSDGALLRVAEWGPAEPESVEAPPVLLVHGLTASLEDWRPVVPALLAAGRRVLAIDLRGHGASSLGSQGMSTRRLADDLADVLTVRDLRDAVVVGHSLGGYAALALAVHRRQAVAERVGRLVLLAASPTLRGPHELATLWQNASPLVPVMERHPRHGPVVMRLSGFGDSPALPALRDLSMRWSQCPLRTRLACAHGLSGQSLRADLGTVGVPVTVVHGDRDRVVPLQRARLLQQELPDAELVVLPGAGHVLPTERPRAVVAAIRGG